MCLFSKLFKRKKKEEEKKDVLVATEKNIEPEKEPVPTEEEKERLTSVFEDDIAAEEISNDKNSESIKVSGLSGFFDIKRSKDNRFVFNLYASNRVIIATSQIYSSSQSALNGANSVIANAEKANIEDQTLKNPTTMPYPKWEITKDKAGQFRFRLCAPNGSCICHSQGYTTKASCKNGIESIIKTVKNAKIDKSYLKKS